MQHCKRILITSIDCIIKVNGFLRSAEVDAIMHNSFAGIELLKCFAEKVPSAFFYTCSLICVLL